MFGGIRSRLLLLVIATVVPFTALIGFALWAQWKADQALALQSALIEARRVADQIEDEIGNLENLLAGLSRAVSLDVADKTRNDALLREVKSELPSYVSNILLTSLDGSNIGTSAEAGNIGRTYLGDRDFFNAIMSGQRFAMGMPVRGRTTGEWIVTVARAVEDRNSDLAALITVGIQIERFQEGLRTNELPDGSVVQVLNSDGIVVARSVESGDWIGRSVPTDRLFQRHSTVAEASEAVAWPDGIERITGSTTLRRLGWRVSVGLPKELALANVKHRLIWGAAASLTALFIAMILAWAIASRIIRPLRQLSEDASTLASGDLGYRTEVSSHDEIGTLASSFNTMAASLTRHRELYDAREAASTEALKRSQSENMERQAKETLAAVIDTSPVAIVCSDTDRRLVLWSQAAERIFGYTAEEVLGKRTKLIPSHDQGIATGLFDRALKGETVRNL